MEGKTKPLEEVTVGRESWLGPASATAGWEGRVDGGNDFEVEAKEEVILARRCEQLALRGRLRYDAQRFDCRRPRKRCCASLQALLGIRRTVDRLQDRGYTKVCRDEAELSNYRPSTL